MNPFTLFSVANHALWWFATPDTAGAEARPAIEPPVSVATPIALENSLATLPVLLDSTTNEQGDSYARLDTAGPKWSWERVVFEEQTYHFKLFVPDQARERALPLIVMLHGAQQDPDDFAAGTQMNAEAASGGYIVLYPEQSESANPMRCWNWFRPGDQQRESGEAAMIAAMTRHVIALYNVDESRVYVAGLSAGGAMAVNLAVTQPDLFAAAAFHSGMAYGVANEPFAALCAMNDGKGKICVPVDRPYASARAVPFIVFHGDADDTVHPRNGDQIVAMSAMLSGDPDDCRDGQVATYVIDTCGSKSHTRHIHHDHAGLLIGEQWVVHGLKHAWSGGHPDGTYTDAQGPSATKEIVRFFAQHSLKLRGRESKHA